MKGALSLLSLPLLAAASPVFKTGVSDEVAPLIAHDNAQLIPDNYIVVFKKHVKSKEHAEKHHTWVQDLHASSEVRRTELRKRSETPFTDSIFSGLKHTYSIGSLMGYSGHFDEDVLESIRNHPDVSLSATPASSVTPPALSMTPY